MKKRILLIIMLFTLLFYGCGNRAKDNPPPTDIIEMKKNRKEFKKHRKDWVERVHRIAPGMNWRKIDTENRLVLHDLRKAMEGIADGRIFGTWNERGSNNLAGRIHTVDIDPIGWEVYAGSSGGNIWKASIGGEDWVSLNDELQFEDIQMVRFILPAVLVLCNNPSGLWWTDDESMWNKATGLESIEEWGGFRRGIIAPDTSMYLLANEWEWDLWIAMTSVYRSVDHGHTFARIDTFHSRVQDFDIWTDRNGGDVFLVAGGSIYRYDGDIRHPLFDFPYSGYDPTNVYLNGAWNEETDETVLYVFHSFADGTKVYRVNDDMTGAGYRGEIPQTPFMGNSIAVSRRDPDKVYIGCVDCFRSHNAGASFEKVNDWWEYYDSPGTMLHADVPGIDVFYNSGADDELVFISTDGGLYLSLDDLRTVNNLSLNNLAASQYYSTYTSWHNTDAIYAGSQDQGFQRTIAAGSGMIDFVQEISGDYGQIVSADSGRSIWTVYPGFAMYAPNILHSWSITTWDFETVGQLWMPPLCEYPGQPNKVLMGGGAESSGARIITLTYTSGSIRWDEGDFDFAEGDDGIAVSGIAYSPLRTDRLYVLTSDGRFFRSDDDGGSWWKNEDFSAPEGHYFFGSKILPSPVSVNVLWVAGSGYSNPPVFRSDDGGLTFVEDWSGLPNTLVYDLACNQEGTLIFAATEVGSFIYLTELETWYPMPGSPDQAYWSVEFVQPDNIARFGTYGRGIWDFRLDSISAVTEEPQIKPEKLSVQVSPNPFNSSTRITLSIQEPAELKIFDVQGKQVAQMSSETGIFEFKPEARLASGTYMGLVRTESSVVPVRLVLVK